MGKYLGLFWSKPAKTWIYVQYIDGEEGWVRCYQKFERFPYDLPISIVIQAVESGVLVRKEESL
jgi:hypothetical protein